MSTINRHTRAFRCPICGGCDQDPRGKAKRCFGFTSEDGLWVRCTREEFANGAEREDETSSWVHHLKDTHPPDDSPPAQPIPVAYYDYTDEEGKLLYQVIRLQPKGFRQRRPDGKGGWIWKIDDTRRVLFRHNEFRGLEKIRLLIVDGEKDVNTAWELGYPATCCARGMGSWQAEYSSFLKGFKVAVAIDRDGGEGHRQAEKVLEILEKDGIEAHAFEFPGEGVKDLTDWVEKENGTLAQLEKLVEKAVDWKAILQAKPVPAADLAPLVGRPIPYTVKPILVRGSLTQIQGTQKGGKSAFANYLALCATLGIWPNSHMEAKDAKRVLYITWEDPKLMIAQRLSLYAKGMGLGLNQTFMPSNLTYLFRPYLSIEDPRHLAAAKQMVKDLAIDILIIDTLAHTHGCDENAASEMRLPMANLAALAEDGDIAIAYLHHIAKMAGDRTPQDRSRGSGAITAAWHVLLDWGVRADGSNVNPVHVQSKFLHQFQKWDIEYIHDGTETVEPTYVKWDIRSADASLKGSPKMQQALEAVEYLMLQQPSGITRYDLAHKMGISPVTAKDYLFMLISQGKVMKSISGGKGTGQRTVFKRTPSTGGSPSESDRD